MKSCSPGTKFILLTIALLGAKLALQIYLYSRGFLSVSADEYSRGITAAQWALDGDIPLKIYMYAWLPFETYVNGLSLMIWDDLIWAPRVTAIIFSCFLLVYFLKLIQYLFANFTVTLIAGLFLVFDPWFAWLSGTPMLDIYYLAPFVAGLYYLLRWIPERRAILLLASGILFFISTGFHSQSWVLVNVVNVCLLYYIPGMYLRKDYTGMLQLAGVFVLSNLFIAVYLPVEHSATGQWLYMFRDHVSGTLEYYNGYQVGLFEKLAYYPRLILDSGRVMIWLFLPVGIYRAVTGSRRDLRLFPLAVGAGALLLYSIYNLFSVPASAAPGRYALPFFILFVPYSALGINTIFGAGARTRGKWLLRAAGGGLVLYIVWTSFHKTLDYETRNARAAVDAGLYIREGLEREGASSNETVLIELAYWDFLYLNLPVRHFDRVRYDRMRKDEYAGTPSELLSMSDDEILERMKRENTKLVAVRDAAIKERLKGLSFIHELKDFGEWVVYETDLNEDIINP